MMITDVAWVRDHQHRCALQLRLDGHPAHILSSQRREYTRRGLLKGIDFLASEWRAQATHAFIRGPVEPGLSERDLAGCTDDPEVFALYEEMCQAILAGTWQPGPRAFDARDGSVGRSDRALDPRHSWLI